MAPFSHCIPFNSYKFTVCLLDMSKSLNQKLFSFFQLSHKICLLGCLQTGATTPNIVAPTMLGVVACVLAVMCKRMQQLATSLGPAVHRGKNTAHRSLWSMPNECAWPLQCWKNCANGSNIVALRFVRSQNKRNVGSCWLKSLTGFKLCAITRNNIQQHATGCAKGRNM